MTIQTIITWLVSLAYLMPLILFIPLGLFLDELFLPVPSPLILTVGGGLAKTQGYPLFFIVVLAVAGAVGKVLCMWFHYFLGDKAEHLLVPKYGKMFGVTQKEIDKLSGKLKGGWRDSLIIFVSRVIPFVPTIPVSFICGILKTNLKSFLLVSFVGTSIRNVIFLYIGFVGASNMTLLQAHIERITQVLLVVFIVGFTVWYYWRRKKQTA